MLVATKLLSRQNTFCDDKSMPVATKVLSCLSRPNYVCRDKIFLSLQAYLCREKNNKKENNNNNNNKTYIVATKMIFVAAPTNDS